MRVRLYISRNDDMMPPGLFSGKGKNKVRISDDIWKVGEAGWTPLWHQFYNRDKAPPGDPWYALDINKFVTLT